MRHGGVALSEGCQLGARGKAKVRKEAAILERQVRPGNEEEEAMGGQLEGDYGSCKEERK